jgi:hypothetical protein
VVPSGYNDENTRLFVVFNNENAAASLYTYSNGAFSTGSYAIGVGRSVTFVSIAIIDGAYQSAFASTTIVNNHEETLQFSATTKEEFEAAVNAL